MKIAWIVYGSLDQRTGGTIYDRIVVDGLRAAGDDVRVYSLEPPPASTALAIPFGLAAGMRLGRALRRSRPDVIVGDELCFREVGTAFPFLRRTRTRRVLLVHHLTSWEEELPRHVRFFAERAEHVAIDASDRLITTSQTTRGRMLAELAHAHRGGVPEIDVVLPGADRLPLLPRVEHDDVRLLFLGAIAPRKRALPLVRAFARAASTKTKLVLLGSTTRDPDYARAVARAIDEHGLADRVTMAGEVAEEGVAQALSESDALVMPSSLEGFGIAATEAIRAGVPVIATRTSGLEEALGGCGDAVRFVTNDDELGSVLHAFTTDRALRDSMTLAAGRARASMQTWQQCVRGFRQTLLGRDSAS